MECPGFCGPKGALQRSSDRGELTMVVKPFHACQRAGTMVARSPRGRESVPARFSRCIRPSVAEGPSGVLESSSRRARSSASHMTAPARFEVSARFSTTVEKTVENRAIDVEPIGRRLILRVFPHGERVCGPCFSGLRRHVGHQTSRARCRSAEAKVPAHQYFGCFWNWEDDGDRGYLGPGPDPDRKQGQPAQLLHLVQADDLCRATAGTSCWCGFRTPCSGTGWGSTTRASSRRR